MIQLTDVNVFLAIAETGSFSAAANRLRAPKSSVARQLQRLEDALQTRLVARTTRSVSLTEDGRAFFPHARRLADDSLEAVNAVRRDASAAGLLSVTAPAVIARHFLASHLATFRTRYPNITLNLDLSTRTLSVHETDVAIRVGAVMDARMKVRSLGVMRSVLVAAPAYLRRRPPILHPSDLTSHAMIDLRQPGEDFSLTLLRDHQAECFRYVPAVQVNDGDTALALCRAGVGVVGLSAFMAADALATGAVVRVLPDWVLPPLPVNVLHDARRAPPMRVRVFVDFLAEMMAEPGPSLLEPG